LRKQKAEGRKQKWFILHFCFLLSAFCFACASKQPDAPTSPEWSAVPPGVVETFCLRLKAEGVAEGQPVAIVSTTQPIASMHAIGALAGPTRRKPDVQKAVEGLHASQRSMPLTLASDGACKWVAVDAANAYRRGDQMVVEMSAPMPNPFHKGAAGMFVRVSLAGEHGQWYWISLLPRAGGWVVGYIEALGV